jgi:hypothetical protein
LHPLKTFICFPKIPFTYWGVTAAHKTKKKDLNERT